MAIHKTLKIITTKYTHEPAAIFTDCLNCLYVINTQIKHPTHHNNHADKTILTDMVRMLKNRTQPTTIHKVKTHINIEGNEQADIYLQKMAPRNCTNSHQNPMNLHTPHHTTSIRTWPGPTKRPDKGHVRCLETCLQKHDCEKNLKVMAQRFPNIAKWTRNPDVDNPTNSGLTSQ